MRFFSTYANRPEWQCRPQEFVGEARAKYNPKAPLIGITPLGIISGGERLRGLDVTRCPQPEDVIKELGKEGSWKKYGYSEDRLPPCDVDAEVTSKYFADVSQELQEKLNGIVDQQGQSQGCVQQAVWKQQQEKVEKEIEKVEKERNEVRKMGENVRRFLEDYKVQPKDRDRKGFDKLTRKLDLFQEMGKLVSKERAQRKLIGAQLDPNHSHFIFADDGGFNFGAETQLRADIETCLAGACLSSTIVPQDSGSAV